MYQISVTNVLLIYYWMSLEIIYCKYFTCRKKYTSQDIRVLFDEAKVYIGCHYLNAKQFEKAIDELKGVKTLIAYFNLGLVGFIPSLPTPTTGLSKSTHVDVLPCWILLLKWLRGRMFL